MSLLSNSIIAISMSADAFAASLAKGTAIKKPRLIEAFKIGLIFGVVETLTPIIGWTAGLMAKPWIEAIDHWVAFGLLFAIGAHMIYEGFSDKEDEEPKTTHSLPILVFTAIGTSIDAMAVGASFAMLGMNIWVAALMIGAATTVMATLGILLGHAIGVKAGKRAEIAAGLCLIAIGSLILYSHLSGNEAALF